MSTESSSTVQAMETWKFLSSDSKSIFSNILDLAGAVGTWAEAAYHLLGAVIRLL